MGNKFEVHVWVPIPPDALEWRFEVVYAGESFFWAMVAMIAAKRKGFGYVKLEWR